MSGIRYGVTLHFMNGFAVTPLSEFWQVGTFDTVDPEIPNLPLGQEGISPPPPPPPPPPPNEIAADTASIVTFALAAQTSITQSVTIENNENRFLLVVLGLVGSGAGLTSATYNGISMEENAFIGDGVDPYYVYAFAVVNPPVGTYDVVVGFSPSANVSGIIIPFYNVDPTYPFGLDLSGGATLANSTAVDGAPYGVAGGYPVMLGLSVSTSGATAATSGAGQTRVATTPAVGTQILSIDTETPAISTAQSLSLISPATNTEILLTYYFVLRPTRDLITGDPNNLNGGTWFDAGDAAAGSLGVAIDDLPQPYIVTMTEAYSRRASNMAIDWTNSLTYYFRITFNNASGDGVSLFLYDGSNENSIYWNGTSVVGIPTEVSVTFGVPTQQTVDGHKEVIIPVFVIGSATNIEFGAGSGVDASNLILYDIECYTTNPGFRSGPLASEPLFVLMGQNGTYLSAKR